MVEAYELSRTTSICKPPEIELLDYVKHNQIQEITRLVNQNLKLLQYTDFDHPHTEKSILQIACCDFANEIQPETIQTLLKLGADPFYSNEVNGYKEAIHFAATSTKKEILTVLLNFLKSIKKNGNINSTSLGNTALNTLMKDGDETSPDFVECAEILIKAGIDVDKGDNNNVTPILLAAKKKYKEIVSLILQNRKNADIDSHKLRGKSARDYIKENKWFDLLLENQNNNAASNLSNDFFTMLIEGNENEFLSHESLNANEDNGENTLLQLAVLKNLPRVVQHLLNHGADPNNTAPKNSKTAIEISAFYGYYKILEIFLLSGVYVPKTILIELLKQIDSDYKDDSIDYKKCYQLLLKHSKQLDFNAIDDNTKTPLHYAVRYSDSTVILNLLECGASLANKDKFGSLPVEDIIAPILEEHLDNCLEVNFEDKIHLDNFTVTYNYRSLIPTSCENTTHLQKRCQKKYEISIDADDTNFLNTTQDFLQEMDVLVFMSKSSELKHLLKHPVIRSFLYMKWFRIRKIFYSNLIFYLLYCLFLLLHIFFCYNNVNEDNSSYSKVLLGLLCVTFILLIFRELFQIAISPKKYISNFENWIEISLIIVTFLIIFIKSPEDHVKKQLSAIAILLAAFELVLLIGQFPEMSTNITMLRTVSRNFFKFFLWYSVLIGGFSLSFYILFTENEISTANKNDTTNNNDAEEQDFFMDPALSVFKTIIMLTGEFDASSINFKSYPILSHILFVSFVFTISIILLNLLNGLAVSDTQLIKNDAELISLVTRIENISYIENTILGNISSPKFIRLIQEKSCMCQSHAKMYMLFRGFGKYVCLFPYFLKNYSLTIYPNRQAQVIFDEDDVSNDSNSDTCIYNCSKIYLDQQTAKCTKKLIRQKKLLLEQRVADKKLELVSQQQQHTIQQLKLTQEILLQKLNLILEKIH